MCETKVAKYSCGHVHRRPVRYCHTARNEYANHCWSTKIISRIEEWDQDCKECRAIDEMKQLLAKAEHTKCEWIKFTEGATLADELEAVEKGKREIAACELAVKECKRNLEHAQKDLEDSVSRALYAVSAWGAKKQKDEAEAALRRAPEAMKGGRQQVG